MANSQINKGNPVRSDLLLAGVNLLCDNMLTPAHVTWLTLGTAMFVAMAILPSQLTPLASGTRLAPGS